MTLFDSSNPNIKKIRFWAALGTLFISSILFLLIPLTQNLSEVDEKVLEYREVSLITPPPPEIEPIEMESENMEIEAFEELVAIEKPIEDIQLQKIDFSLNPGMGVGLAMGSLRMPNIDSYSVTTDIEKIFNFDELGQAPTLLNGNQIRMEFPKELVRRRIKSVVVTLEIVINKSGDVSDVKVLKSTYNHPKVRETAKRAALQAKFSITRINGKPVTVKGSFPITLQSPRQ